MAAIKTDGNQETLDHDAPLPDDDWAYLRKRLDHLDDLVHRIDQRTADMQALIDEHKPALARGLSLMDPGAKIRGMIGKKSR